MIPRLLIGAVAAATMSVPFSGAAWADVSVSVGGVTVMDDGGPSTAFTNGLNFAYAANNSEAGAIGLFGNVAIATNNSYSAAAGLFNTAIADNNKPFVESHFELGSFEIEATQTPLDLRFKLLLERASLDDPAQLGGDLLAKQSDVGVEARHANFHLAAGKRRFRKRSRPFESHDMRAAHLSHPKHHSLLAQIPSRCVEIDGP